MSWARLPASALLCCALSIAAPPWPSALFAGTAADDDEKVRIYVGRPFIVTASRLDEPLERALKSVTLISSEDISRQQALTVAEVLRNVPGLDIQSSGSTYGSAVDVRLRGADTDQVLVLIDGMQVNSPWVGSFSFSDLPAENIERIEVVRGPASALYGSEAVGGVINIISKSGRGGFHPSLTVEGGTLGTARALASLSGGQGALDYALTLSRLTTDGNQSRDSYRNSAFAGRLGVRPSPDKSLVFSARYIDGRKELPFDFPFAGLFESELGYLGIQTNDPNNSMENRSLNLSLQYAHEVNDRWDYSVTLGQINGTLDNENLSDPDSTYSIAALDTTLEYTTTILRSGLDVRRSLIETQHNLGLLPWGVLSLGVEAELEEAERIDFSNLAGFEPEYSAVDVHRSNLAYFVQEKLTFGPPEPRPGWREAKDGAFTRMARHLELGGSLVFGARLDDNSQFGSEVSPKAAGGFDIGRTGTSVAVIWGESFNAPSLTDLYFPVPEFSNPDLQPETSTTTELALRQKLLGHRSGSGMATKISRAVQAAKRAVEGLEIETGAGPAWVEDLGVTLELSYFKTDYQNLIAFDMALEKPWNVARAEVEGVEAALAADVRDKAGVLLSCTHLNAKKWASANAASQRLQRRPRGLFSAALWAGPFQGLSGRMDLNTTSSMEDNFNFIGADGVLRLGDTPGFTRVDLALSYALTSKHKIHLRLENLFDEDYEEVKGFPAPGRALLAGVTLSI